MTEINIFIKLAAAFFLIYLALVCGLYLFQRKIIYIPSHSMLSPAESGVPEMQELQVTTHDGVTLTFWYRAACNNQPTIVYFHGNKGNLSGRSLKIKPYLDAGFGVLLGAYRGYGHNSGKPNELGLYSDARAQLSFLKSRGIHSKNLILYGESLGSGVAVNMAFEMAVDGQLGEISAPVGGLILEAPFSSLPFLAQEHYPFVPAHLMVWDHYNSKAKIPKVDTPVLIVHGQEDRVVSVEHGMQLFQASSHPKQAEWVSVAGHNNLYEYGMADLVIKFIDKYVTSEH